MGKRSSDKVSLMRWALGKARTVPVADFYYYQWKTDKSLLVGTLFVNYVFPLLIEAMPWYFNKRKVSKRIRDSRNAIQHQLIAKIPLVRNEVLLVIGMNMVYACLQTLDMTLRTRMNLANRLLVKRLVMERILYSEIGALQQRYLEVFGETIRTEELENRVFKDISESLHLFNFTIPSIVRNSFTLVGQAYSLYQVRKKIDALTILRPTIVGMVGEAVELMRYKTIETEQMLEQQRTNQEMSRIVSNIVDGLSDVQCNNMQECQLRMLDGVIDSELESKEGPISFMDRVYRSVSNRGAFSFATEVFIDEHVMSKRNIDHETYRKMQNDIDYVGRLCRRTWNMIISSYKVFDTQFRVMALLQLPNFKNEHKKLPPVQKDLQLKELTIRRACFAYSQDGPLALRLGRTDSTEGQLKQPSLPEHGLPSNHSREAPVDEDPIIRIQRGRSYAIIGQNKSGKSTLLKLLCKLHSADDSDIRLNDIAYQELPRSVIRSMMSYVAQKPFIFPGTIEENIRVGNTQATREQVIEAARAAGVFMNEQPRPVKSKHTGSVFANKSVTIAKPWEVSHLQKSLKFCFGEVCRYVYPWIASSGPKMPASSSGSLSPLLPSGEHPAKNDEHVLKSPPSPLNPCISRILAHCNDENPVQLPSHGRFSLERRRRHV